jgi:hypothetical protein
MPTRRYGHVCALVRNIESGDAEIVVVGGSSSSLSHLPVEIFNVKSLSWRTGGKLLNSRPKSFKFTLLESTPATLVTIKKITINNLQL